MSNAGEISEKKRRRSRKRQVKVESYIGGIPILFCCICTWDIIILRLLAFRCSSTVTKGVKISTQFELRFRFAFRYVVSARRSNCTGFLAVWSIPLYSIISATLLLWIYIGTAGADRLMSQYLSLKARVHFTKMVLTGRRMKQPLNSSLQTTRLTEMMLG